VQRSPQVTRRRGEAGFGDFLRSGQGDSQEDADREYSEPVQVAFDAGVECAEEQEEGVNREILFGRMGRSEVIGAPFFVGAFGGEASREQIPRSARDDRFLVFRRLRRIAIGSAVDIEPKKNGHNLCRLCPQERNFSRATPEWALSPAFATWLWQARGRYLLRPLARMCCERWQVR